MAQAFDDDGRALGPEIIRPTLEEAFDDIRSKHEDAAEYRVRKLRESIPDDKKLDMILEGLDAITKRLDALDRAPDRRAAGENDG